MRALIVAGAVGLGGLLGSGAAPAQAQDFGFGGPRGGFGLSIGVGSPYGYGVPGYGYGVPGYGYGRGPVYGHGRGYGYGSYYPGSYSSYYSSRTTITTIVHCGRCGGYHRQGPCGGGHHGGGHHGGGHHGGGHHGGGHYPGPYYPW